MTIKAVFFDIDGTLLTDNRTVSQSTIFAINQLKKRGILVGLATGRDPRFLLKYMASLGLDVAIAYNGQYIFSRTEVLFARELEKTSIYAVIDYAQKYQKELALGTATGVVGSGIMNFGMGTVSSYVTRFIPKSWSGFVNRFFNRFIRKVNPQTKEALYQFGKQPIYQMVLLSTEREAKNLQKQFPQLSFTRSSAYATDILSHKMSKLKGIEIVGDYYHFTTNQVMVFGDANNDVEMLKGVKYSIAMGNATRKAKQVASYVTASNNQNGIFKAIRQFGLIDEESNVPE